MRPGRQHTPEARARIAAATCAAMDDPAVRARISAATKAGMARAAGSAPELSVLRSAWAAARPSVREKFITELLGPLFSVEQSDG
jgi:hypothetical protein